MTVAVPRFACVRLPYPPQPPIASPIATIVSAAVAVMRKGRSVRTFPLAKLVHTARLHNPKANRSAQGPILSGVSIPERKTAAEVVTVNLVLARS
jgi:hypothetical protein